MEFDQIPRRVDIDSLRKINRRIAISLERLRDVAEKAEYSAVACTPTLGMLGYAHTINNISSTRDVLDEEFTKSSIDPSVRKRIDDDTYNMIKQEIDATEKYIDSYLDRFNELCECKSKRFRS